MVKRPVKQFLVLVALLAIWLIGCQYLTDRSGLNESGGTTPSLTTVAATPGQEQRTPAGGTTPSAGTLPIAVETRRALATAASQSSVMLDSPEAIPLTDMANTTYLGFEGGLYPGGVNEMPTAHGIEGLNRARMVRPLNREGEPDPDGKYVLLSIGMSNTSMEFCRALAAHSETDGVTCAPQSFMSLSADDPAVNHSNLVAINGARGAQVAVTWDSADEENYHRIRDDILEPLGLSEKQVQVIWLKVTNGDVGSDPSLPSEDADAYRLLASMGDIVRALKERYPNLQQVYLSSRIYAGYTTRDLNPEPYAYETGFAVKWLIEAQIRQVESGRVDPLAGDLNYDTVAPWLAWGPYLWADGSTPRSDGLVWLPEDFGDDGTHPSVTGREKVGALLLDFFKSSPFTRCWFLASAAGNECRMPVAGDEAEAATASPTTQALTRSNDGQAVPLTEMGDAIYLGFTGGLYPNGSNEMPEAHAAEGLQRAAMVQPLSPEGRPDPNGTIVLLSIGMSNTMMEFCGEYVENTDCKPYSFIGKAMADPAVDHSRLAIVNGARGAQIASRWDSSSDGSNYDQVRDGFLVPSELSEQQVQVIWLKVTDFIRQRPPLPAEQAHAYQLMATMGDIVRALKKRYPNLQQVFLSSRIYAGYATRDLNPEPYAYETGFAVKWLIEAQIEQMESGRIDPRAGDLDYNNVAPWLAWGPYLWADGSTPRSDGLTWLPEDFGDDGTHPSVLGREKVGALLLHFFRSSPFTRCWFLTGVACSVSA